MLEEMQVNRQMEGAINGASEQACSSDDGQFAIALRKMMKKEVEMMVIHTVHQVIGPFMETVFRRVVKEEIQSIGEKFLSCVTSNHASKMTKPRERSLQLKFLDEISAPVLTGKEIQGKGGAHVRVALVDDTTGQVVNCGPESSAKVEILILDSSDDVNEYWPNAEDFNQRIIREDAKKKPHFAKSYYIYLDKGVGVLRNAKLGHDSGWMRSCNCRLGARIVGNLGGIEVKEGSTKSFAVLDSRSKLYEKHYPPTLSDLVWRLENIGKDGPRCKLLNEKLNVFTVGDFLFFLSIDPQRLRKIVGCGSKWEATVDHARTCVIDDKRIYLYYPSTENNMGVAYDVVGGLKGLIHESSYVPVDLLSADEKVRAHDLLLSAFENQKEVTYFNDENTLRHHFPCRPITTDASTSSSVQDEPGSSDRVVSENIDSRDTTVVGPTSPEIMNFYNESTSASAEHIYNPYMAVPEYDMPSPGQFYDLDHLLQHFEENETLLSMCFPESQNDTGQESHYHQRASNIAAVICAVRAGMRFMASGGLDCHKRRRV